MCTVSFVPLENGYCITSNRDEKLSRKTAYPPTAYSYSNTTLYYPKDTEANGSWFVCNDKGDSFILLNGAFKNHISKPPYFKSRGLILLEIAAAQNALQYFKQISLKGIEPFTLIIFQQCILYECRWDSSEKFCTELGSHLPHIWSSATLYSKVIQDKRAEWFIKALQNNELNTPNDIVYFHQFAGDNDRENNLVMQRSNNMQTISITSVFIQKDITQFSYIDLLANKASTLAISFQKQ